MAGPCMGFYLLIAVSQLDSIRAGLASATGHVVPTVDRGMLFDPLAKAFSAVR